MTDHRKDAETRVEQVDRNAALACMREAATACEAIATGGCDEVPFVQFLARHREAAYQRGLADAGVENARRFYETVKGYSAPAGRGVSVCIFDDDGWSVLNPDKWPPPTSEPMVSREAAARIVDGLNLPVKPTVHHAEVHGQRVWNAACKGIAAAIRGMSAATPTQDQTNG